MYIILPKRGSAWSGGGSGVSGRYVKFDFASNWGDSTWAGNLCIIYVCDADGNKLNDETMAHTGTSAFIGAPENMSDTNETNYWLSFKSAFPTWWKVDLGEIMDISKVKLKTYYNAPPPDYTNQSIKAFTVSLSDDDSSWTEVLNTDGAQTFDLQTFDLV